MGHRNATGEQYMSAGQQMMNQKGGGNLAYQKSLTMKGRIQSAVNTGSGFGKGTQPMQALKGYQSGLLSDDPMNTFGGTTYDQQSLNQQMVLSAGKGNHLPTIEDPLLIDENKARKSTEPPIQGMARAMHTTHSGTGIPHGMINHQLQANSKKSFRIRGREEYENRKQQISLAQSQKDFMEFNNGK